MSENGPDRAQGESARLPPGPLPDGRRSKRSEARAKRRWGYGELTLLDIVEAASRLVQRVGIAKVTMRAVCEELGLSSMAVYYYVPNKETLLDLVIDEACAGIEIPPPGTGRWDERLRLLLGNARRAFLRYPGLANLMQVRPVTPQAMRLGEAADRLLLEGGFVDDETRRYALSALINYLFGALAWESTLPNRSRNQTRDAQGGSGSGPRADEWSYRQTMLSQDELFEYGLDMAIIGLRHKASDESGSEGDQRRGGRPRAGAG